MSKLAERTALHEVRNVLVFVADSVRSDHLPRAVAESGLVVNTISAGTFTAASLPSMFTGTYPATHKVWTFSDVLADCPALFELPYAGMHVEAGWQDGSSQIEMPPMRILRCRSHLTFEEALDRDRFLLVYHDKGAHAPYDYFNVEWDESPAFFRAFADRRDELPDRYERGARSAGERFLSMRDELEDRGMLDETLLVFTSDHGELLGEAERGGVFAHGHPICPELVRVPTVFTGAGLSEGERLDELASGIDVAPTVLSSLGHDVPPEMTGVDLWTGSPPPGRMPRADHLARWYGGSSAWDADGGYVHHHRSRWRRLAFALYANNYARRQAPAIRSLSPRRQFALLRTYGPPTVTYGSPDIERARGTVVREFERADRETDVTAPTAEQLEALGYRK